VIIHGASLGIGAAIATGAILLALIVNGMNFDQPSEIVLTSEVTPSSEVIQAPELSQTATPKRNVTMAVFSENRSPVLGSDDAPIVLVEFGDYQCYFCNAFFHNTKDAVIENFVDTGKVKMIFKDFTIIGPDSVTAANAAHCAQEQGKFWEYHDTLYNNWTGENNGWAASENLYKFATQVSLDEINFDRCMQEKRYQNTILASNADGNALGITGTPAFFVITPDQKIIPLSGAQPYEVFERTFNTILEN